jgi:hypothetical protein
MTRPWHKTYPSRAEKIRTEVQEVYPNLHFYPLNERVVVRGTLPIIDAGTELDRYSVEIVLLADYPTALPLVWETDGKIPRNVDHHVSESGQACLFIPDERWKIYPPGTTFLQFLNGPVRNFFLGQSVFRRTGEWPFGQRRHRSAGILEYYGELLRTDDETVILCYLECLSRPTLKGHWPCPCKSGKRVRDCHRHQIKDLREKIPCEFAKKSLRSVTTDIGRR